MAWSLQEYQTKVINSNHSAVLDCTVFCEGKLVITVINNLAIVLTSVCLRISPCYQALKLWDIRQPGFWRQLKPACSPCDKASQMVARFPLCCISAENGSFQLSCLSSSICWVRVGRLYIKNIIAIFLQEFALFLAGENFLKKLNDRMRFKISLKVWECVGVVHSSSKTCCLLC